MVMQVSFDFDFVVSNFIFLAKSNYYRYYFYSKKKKKTATFLY